ncbi:hypothetical protein C2857_007039 [Epichloe festucae Fl1]|uniref:SMP domain-containing protein n=1 Tax=Epichloe festucae (strain Fl1) TaxID=877507 RepID=A0A7S9PUJ8_EPIFF|nr:hypothetical protein C2857_007039 [Epichloe festucae Fl1]
MPEHKMSKADASRIQSGQARNGGDMSSSGFASRAQAAGDRNAQASGNGNGNGNGNGGTKTDAGAGAGGKK